MAFIPESVKHQSIVTSLKPYLISQGKVGDKYAYPGRDDLLVSVRSNRLSVFDFVLALLVERKGVVLTEMSRFFADYLLDKHGIRHHLVKSDKYPDANMVNDLWDQYPDIDTSRTFVIRKADILQYELIFRHHIGGSVWGKYEKNGIVAGIQLPKGLKKWQRLEEPFFTPSTKSETGHDVNISQQEFFAATGDSGRKAVKDLQMLYALAYEYAMSKGILILDSKFEIEISKDGTMMLCDEWLTPDSSRYVDVDDFNVSMEKGSEPSFMDKQPVRDFCAKIETPFFDEKGNRIIGFKGLDPENPEHVAYVSGYDLPQEVADNTTTRYDTISKRLIDWSLAY